MKASKLGQTILAHITKKKKKIEEKTWKLQEEVDPGTQLYGAGQEHGEHSRPVRRGPESECCPVAETMSSLWSVSNPACEADPLPDTQNKLEYSVQRGERGGRGRLSESGQLGVM